MAEKRKVLVVDDERDILDILGVRLSSVGYEVLKAENGKEAIEIAKIKHPDIIILDVMMPDMPGDEVARKLKDDPITKNIPIMFLTCLLNRKEELGWGHEIGGQVFFAKPYNPQELIDEIGKLIQK